LKFPGVCREGESLVGLWVWDPLMISTNREPFERVIKRWRVSRIYIAPVDGWERVVGYLKGLGLEVFVVESSRSMRSEFDPFLAVSIGADGYQIDLEPYWGRGPERFRGLAGDYLRVLKNLKGRTGALTFSVAIPHWFDRVMVGNKTLAERVFEIADEVVVMAYSPNLRTSLRLASREIDIAQKLGKRLMIGLEATAYLSSDTVPLSLGELATVRNIRCRGVHGFVINSLDALL